MLDSIPYYGGIYTNKNAVKLLTDIFTVAKVPYNIDDVFADEVVTGYIPFTTCRDALMQVAFAIQAVVDTSNSEVVKVFALEDEKFYLIFYHTCTRMKFHTRTILYKGTVKLFYIDYLILGFRENFFKKKNLIK